MSKNLIFYFTGTGNSLKVAKGVAECLDDCKVIAMTAFKDKALPNDAERVGFVFPGYGSLPNFVNKFISGIALPNNANIYYYTIVTCGYFKWNSIFTVSEILKEKGITLNAGFDVKMVANAIPMYNIPAKTEKIHKKSQKKINAIAEKIKRKETTRLPYRNALFFWQANFVKQFPAMDKDFNVSSNCTSCGICKQVCPVKNIEVTDGRRLSIIANNVWPAFTIAHPKP